MNNAEIKKILISILKEIYPIGSFVRMASVVQTYKVSDKYVCDIKVLNNDGTEDENFPQINSVEIPVIWAGSKRGIICPPEKDMICDVYFLNGDINFPRISNFRNKQDYPQAEIGELVVQQNEETYIKIDKDNNIEISSKQLNLKLSDKGSIEIEKALNIKVSEDIKIECNNAEIKCKGNAKIETTGNADIKATGNVSVDGATVAFCSATAAQGAVGVGSPCPLTGTHSKGSSKVFISGV